MADDDPSEETEPEAAPEPEPPTRYGVPVTESRGQVVLHPSRDELLALLQTLRTEGFHTCLDVCGVDYLDHQRADLPPSVQAERFEVVYNLISHTRNERLRLRVQVPADDPTVPSAFDAYPGTETPERETFDLMGIVFTDHPDPTRILMPEDWEGHPLRKDTAVGRIPVQFKGAPSNR